MSSKAVPRDVGSLLKALRKFCFGGREWQTHLRFEGHNFASRGEPQPTLPSGPSHKLASNQYQVRDARRTSRPPQAIYIGQEQSQTKTPQLKSH
ncbi:unnamed protein product [Brachionus calyciflorus]|uniref:NADH dehydrogenase [ubiquinone] 1 alpha subcomplex subunit 7 n=1 Tax=Brachionus calyciflorus TaxID=104777 RepID=A0A813X144_9BILA|nr:unnamed protein product [Brachionus calyciflorus]